jgi:hypothetical protein
MTTYSAPLRDMQFVMKDLADLDGVIELPGYALLTVNVRLSSAQILYTINHARADHSRGDRRGYRHFYPRL